MDVLAGYQPRAVARLDEIATMLGFPGKMGMDGSKVWDNFQDGDIEGIRNYCETDVLNTYLVYQRFELIRGRINADQYAQSCEAGAHGAGEGKQAASDRVSAQLGGRFSGLSIGWACLRLARLANLV